jgi:cobalt-precorrin-5B (C1)-methyltransferase
VSAKRPRPLEPPLADEVARRVRGLRTGWTTGTCASAAAKAAATGLRDGKVPDAVDVGLPDGSRVRFSVEVGENGSPFVVKDAGDDPDCTDGAHITATATYADPPPGLRRDQVPARVDGVALFAGDGVGIVTRPGLGIALGEPSITPVPRRMIAAALREVTDLPLSLVISVPGGEAMALKTSNARLGIEGGISILGTTGIVRPFSTAAWRTSIVRQLDVAGAGGARLVVLATGSRTERWAAARFSGLDPACLVEVGDFCGLALRRAALIGAERVVVVAMAGKIAKLAAGVMMTHFHRSRVDSALLAEVARATGAPSSVVEAAQTSSTARHFCETCLAEGATAALDALCERAAEHASAFVGGRLAVEVWMVDFDASSLIATSAGHRVQR